MNKALLAKRISAEAGISLEKARDALDCFLNAVCEEIEEGGEVNLHGFGCFFAEKRADRMQNLVNTGENRKVKGQYVAKFKAGKNLRNSARKRKD